jgi:hypothetical protein
MEMELEVGIWIILNENNTAYEIRHRGKKREEIRYLIGEITRINKYSKTYIIKFEKLEKTTTKTSIENNYRQATDGEIKREKMRRIFK